MDRKIILPLLVASAVIGCLSVQINIPQDRDSFFPGFLLYLSGNLEAGSTATAYIETNFTDPFAARLDFVHSYEDRHFYGEARIVNGSGVIEFEVPDVDYWYGTVNFTGIMEGSRQMFTSPKTNFIYIYQHSQKVTFIETDKPLYKPGQEVKFRLLTIDSQFKPETSNVPKIQIESPNQIRLEQWRDVERPDGLVDLSFQLISEPALGEYKIKAYVNDAWVTQPFKVDEYVLPKVEVTVNAPSFVLITAKEYSFQVCAKYTYGQPVRGSVFGEVGKLRKDYFFYYRRRPNPVLGGDEEEPDVELIDAISFSGELDSEGCLESSVSGLNLSSYDTPYYRHSLAVRATVVEATTGDEFIEVTDASKLETVPVNINLESPESFKPGIPYHGRIKVTYPDGKPAPNEELNITATVDRETAYTGDHTSDSEGIVEFDIPYAVVDKSISLQVEAKAYPYQYNPYGYNIYSPTMRFNLDPSYSPTGRYLQIAPILHSVNAGDELTFQVFYTSDDDAVTSDFKVQLISRNKLVHAGATQEGNSRRRRAVMLDAHEQLTECQHQAQEAVGKGDQSSFVPVCEEDGSFSRQQCMPSTNRCWCVNPENGLEIPLTSRQSPDEEYLDCEDTEEEGPIEVPIGELGPPDAFNQCPEGFKFGDGVKKCVRETECERQVREVMGKGLLGAQTPTCDEAGNFMLEQCHGSSGYCWCVDTVTGLELPGTKTGPTENNTDCEAFIARQETECQRQVHEVTGKGLLGARTPMCDEAGNFMLEQCHGSSGYCWCVDTVTGQELPGTKTGPTESNTDCEAFIARQETECQRQVREVMGKGLLGARIPTCDEAGNFMLEQCHGSSGYCWCVDTVTGLELPGTKTGPTENNTDCEAFIARQETECQRQLREVELKGLALGGWRPNCDEDGNFVPEQCHGSSGYCWCVDILTGLEIPETETGPTEDNVDCEAVTPVPTLKLQTLETLTLVLQTPEPIVHVDPQALHEVSFTVPITAGMSPEAKLLVYYTSPEGEVVADSVNIKINEAFENEVKLEFLDKQVLPGSETTLKVSAANGSLCGIGIVDKSVYVLGGENKVTPKKLFSAFDLSTRTTYDDRDCPSRWYRFRKKRDIIFPGFFHSTVNYVDSSEAFSNAGLKAITNYDLNVAPCVYSTPEVAYYYEDVESEPAVARKGSGGPSKASEEKIRSYFPETWLWSLTPVSNAEVEVPLTVPHTITDWIANGLCTNVEKGLGVSPPVVLRAFQSFFLSMSLPYSIIRTEKTPIKVTVFNYLDQCLVVRVTLEENEGFVLSGSNEYTVAVPAGEATTVTYKVAAFVLGSIPLQVSAKSISDDEFLCGNEAVAGPAGSKDAVRRDLKVKPEGEQETTTESAYFCLEEDETYNKHVSLKIPPQRVPGTEVGEISVTGDLVGNTLSNVESMLRMPYGCGEQNLVSMVPNIVALQYLESVGEATPEITAEAKKYILSGYQRELNYRRSDNSYAAFGESNPSGSTFLTAFVVRTYAHAQKFVDVDEEDLYVTIQWLRSIQNEDGSFRTVGYLAHKAMKGGVNNNVTLAAYMVATFLEAGYDSQDKTVAAALAYIDSRLDTLEDTYSMALLAYAYALAGSDRFDDVYEMLQEVAVESEGTKHWESNRDLPEYASYYQDSSKAQNIEMTAYVLRAMVFKRIPNLEVEGSVIARWLVSQRNPRGGFSSTQDTVIGLTALAEFSALGTSENSDLTLTMNIRGGSTLQFDVDYDNRFIVQKGSFEDFPAEVSVSAEGQGCALYSISGDYYIKRDKQTLDPFTLDVKAKAQEPKARKRRDAHEGEEHEHEYEEEEATCEKFTISVSARYNGEDGASNMAIINFRPVSGFVFDKESLEAMLEKYFFVKRYEINEDIITFYFDEITNDNVEFEFDVTKEFDVEDAKPAFMNILDYYENGLKVAEEFEFVCADDVLTSSPSTTYTTPPSPSGFASSSSTMTPDFDECTIPDVCGGPEYQCVNYPGTYECICADGYALDEDEENCVEVPSCPMCSGEGFPLGVDELICASDSIRVMKVRGDGSFRPLNDLLLNEDIIERIYYDVEMNEACTCDVISSGERIIVVASSDHVGPSSGKRDERVLLDEDVVIVLSVSVNKKDIKEILDSC